MSTTNESKGFYKLSWLQRIGFGSGDLAQNLIFQTTCMYLLFFYTDIYGLDAVDVSVMFTVGNVLNVIWDPIVGAMIDKNNPKLGKYRAYLVFVGIPLTGFAILCFWNGFAPSLWWSGCRFWSAAADCLLHRPGSRGTAKGSYCMVYDDDHLRTGWSGFAAFLLHPV